MNMRRQVKNQLVAAGIRAEMDDRSEKVGYKIREAETQKIPFMLVVGQKEADQNMVSVRKHREGDSGLAEIPAVIAEIQEKVIAKA